MTDRQPNLVDIFADAIRDVVSVRHIAQSSLGHKFTSYRRTSRPQPSTNSLSTRTWRPEITAQVMCLERMPRRTYYWILTRREIC
jgi:hypothetical protein